jgi:hypothetical protein
MGQDVDQLVDRRARRAAVRTPPHRLEGKVTLGVHHLADHGQEGLVVLPGALEQHLVSRATLEAFRLGEVQQLDGFARRGREGFLDINTGAGLEALARQRVVGRRRRDDVHH